MDHTEDKSVGDQLRAAIEHLSLPGDEALRRRGCATPDQLAIDFDEAYTAFVGRLTELPGEHQLEALQNLDAKLESMSDPSLREKWTSEAMKKDPDWQIVRALAGAVREAFDW